jgi:DNA-binding MurR/RpiR family transcriptional regulator
MRADDRHGDVAGRIRSHLEQLSPNDRLIARYLLDNYSAAPFETAESLSHKTGVSKAAVVRFAVRVGFPGYTELHEALQEEAMVRLAPATPVRSGGDVIDGAVERARSDLDVLRATIDRDEFDQAVALLCKGPGKIGIFGHRKSAALAEYAYYLLNPLLSNVWPIAAGEPGIADQLIDIEPRDRLLAFTFRRYAKVTAEVVRSFEEAGGSNTVLVTDDIMAPAASIAAHVLVCPPAAAGDFDSAAPGTVLVEALAGAIAVRMRGRSGRRLDLAEQLWKQFGTY